MRLFIQNFSLNKSISKYNIINNSYNHFFYLLIYIFLNFYKIINYILYLIFICLGFWGFGGDRKSTRLNSSHCTVLAKSRMPSSA